MSSSSLLATGVPGMLLAAWLGLGACAAPPPDDTPPPSDDGGVPDQGCSGWQIGTLTGYDNSNFDDDPHAGSVMEFTGLTDDFYDHVDMAAIDFGDWDQHKYRWVDVRWNGAEARVGVWDACRNEDCPDGTDCCTNNKERFAQPGYLVDMETRTAARLFGVSDAESTLNDQIEYRVCGAFDPDAIANQYGVFR